MKGFGLLLMLAAVAVMLTCGPPGVFAGENEYMIDQIRTTAAIAPIDLIFDTNEFPGAGPVGYQGVPDPGSCSDTEDAVDQINSDNELACRGRPIRRAGARVLRLLTFPLRC